ncbi:MAG: hypothetical protein AB3N20_08055 [Rhizobiaceae bacterium]
MPQFLVFAAAAVVGWLGYKAFLREAERVHKRVRRAEEEAANRAHGTLVQDPETGEYRVQKD